MSETFGGPNDDILATIFGSSSYDSGGASMGAGTPAKVGGSSGMDGNTLIAALGGDVVKGATAFFTAQTAQQALKSNPSSASTLILVAGGVAVLIVVVLLLKK